MLRLRHWETMMMMMVMVMTTTMMMMILMDVDVINWMVNIDNCNEYQWL